MPSERPKVAAVVGPTAAGKTALALDVAESLHAEIVSVDSMQIYRGMDVGTAKPLPAERRDIPHHLLDVADPRDDVSVAEFQRLARAAIGDIWERGKLPLLVGGSGLYLRAVVDDLDFPPRDTEVRAGLEAEIEDAGPETLYARLRGLDPEAAAKMEPRNARRIVRALEAIAVTGRPFSENVTWQTYESIYDLSVVGLSRDRADLYSRIEARVDWMLDEGLEREARAVARTGIGRTASQALGYRQVLEGEADLREAIVRATKRFARRQESWFRQDPRVRWFDASAPGLRDLVGEHFRHTLRLP